MMNQSIHLISSSIPGYTIPNSKFPVSRNKVFPSSSQYHPKTLKVSCNENNNHRRNPDFSRQQKGSSSRSRNRHYQDRKKSENHNETDPLTSKNGSILSLSSSQRYSTTSAPGRREKEIVELFRKVQAQLRERAAIKEEHKKDPSQHQGQQGDRGTVDSLLNLLRKHSVAQNKKNVREDDFHVDEPEKSKLVEEEQSSNFLSSNSIESEPESEQVRSVRPASSFRRRSPVPRVKFQPVFLKSEESRKDDVDENEEEKLVSLKEIDDIISEVVNDNANVYDNEEELEEEIKEDNADVYDNEEELEEEEIKEDNAEEQVFFNHMASMKLVELKEIAKARGLKGYSKMKKSDLIELLNS